VGGGGPRLRLATSLKPCARGKGEEEEEEEGKSTEQRTHLSSATSLKPCARPRLRTTAYWHILVCIPFPASRAFVLGSANIAPPAALLPAPAAPPSSSSPSSSSESPATAAAALPVLPLTSPSRKYLSSYTTGVYPYGCAVGGTETRMWWEKKIMMGVSKSDWHTPFHRHHRHRLEVVNTRAGARPQHAQATPTPQND
jgi:hypothetical protein